VKQYWSTDSTQYTLKCVDTETGKIVGMALWDIYLTPSKWRRSELFWLSGQERERADALIQPLWNAREMLWLDERYLYCHILAVHPEYQRRGIGELLMQFGIDVAQKAVLPIYVESSREGVRLYEKTGCRRIKTPAGIRSDIPKPEGTAKVKEDSDVALFVWTSDAGLELLPKTIEIV
jgi:ribosomal protein S18 acetylase RimI-like enzyme